MTVTTNYGWTLVEPNQSNKHITVNEAIQAIDTELFGLLGAGDPAVGGDVSGTVSNVTVTKIQNIAVSTTDPTTNQVLKYNGTVWEPAADASASSVTMGGDVTGNSATATVAKFQGRAFASTAPTDGQVIAWDNSGTTWKPVTPSSGLTDAPSDGTAYERKDAGWVSAYNGYDVPIYIPDKPTASMICARIVAVRAFTLPSSLTGSYAKAETAATGSTTFTIYKNASSIGSFNFAAAATTGTFTFASSTSFAAGDVLKIVAPGTADATLADISITFLGTRT